MANAVVLPDDANQKLTTPQKEVVIVRLYTQHNNNAAETARQFSTLFPGFTVTARHVISQ